MGGKRNLIAGFKRCPKCNEAKPTDQFKLNKHKSGGFSTYCKACTCNYNKPYNDAKTEREKQKRAPFTAERLAIMAQRKIDRELARELAKQNHPKTIRQQLRDQGLNRCIKCDEVKPIDAFEFDKSRSGYKNQCSDCKKKYNRALPAFNTPEYKKKLSGRQSAYTKKRKKIDPVFRLKVRVRKVINDAISRKGYKKNGRSFEILGCSYQEFKAHIESQFKDGMSWDNFDLVHIDHIIPMKSAKTEADVLRLNHFTNLQPLWAHDNMKKSAKMPHITIQSKVKSSYARAKQIKLKQQSLFEFDVAIVEAPRPHFWGLGYVREIYV